MAIGKALKNSWFLLVCAPVWVCAFAGAPFAVHGFFVLVMLLAAPFEFVRMRREDKRIIEMCRSVRGECLNCGYDLTGNVSGTCPECGRVKPN